MSEGKKQIDEEVKETLGAEKTKDGETSALCQASKEETKEYYLEKEMPLLCREESVIIDNMAIDKRLAESIALSENVEDKREKLELIEKNVEAQLLQGSASQKCCTSDELSSKGVEISSDIEPVVFFCKRNVLQFFQSGDFSLPDCGYDKYDSDLTPYEKELCSFKKAELQTVLPSVLSSFRPSLITDCGAFIRYMLKTICVQFKSPCAHACRNCLQDLFSNHPLITAVKVTSAEIFELIFNYGVDTENCQLLNWLPKQKDALPKPRNHVQNLWNTIPDHWSQNLKFLLDICANLINICQNEAEELHDLILLLLYMSLDVNLWKYNVHGEIQHFLAVCLAAFSDEYLFPSIIKTVLSLDAPSKKEKWISVHIIAKMIPVNIESGTHLRKRLCLSALKELYMDFSGCAFSSESQDYEFDFERLYSLMKVIFQLDSNAEDIACKFLDMCIHHVNIPEDQLQPFCDFLLAQKKVRELSQSDSPFLRICTRMIIMYVPAESHLQKNVIQLSSDSEDFESAPPPSPLILDTVANIEPSSSIRFCSSDCSNVMQQTSKLHMNRENLSGEFHAISDPNENIIRLESSESEEDFESVPPPPPPPLILGSAINIEPSSSALFHSGDCSCVVQQTADLSVNRRKFSGHTINDPSDNVIQLESSESEEDFDSAPPPFILDCAATAELSYILFVSDDSSYVIQPISDLHVDGGHFSGVIDAINEPNVSYDSKKMKVQHESVVKSSNNICHDPCTSSSVCTSSISVKRKNRSSDGQLCYKKKICNIDSSDNSEDTVSSCEETMQFSRNTKDEETDVNKEDSSEDDDINFLCVVSKKRKNFLNRSEK